MDEEKKEEKSEEKPKYEYRPPEDQEKPKETEKHQEETKPAEQKEEKEGKGVPRKKGRKWIYAAILIVAFIGGFFVFSFPLTGFFLAEVAREGDTVSVSYTGSLEDGTVFDTNIEEVAEEAGIEKLFFQPLEFTLGQGQVIAGFEEAVLGMRIGEKKTVTLPPEKGYGDSDPSLIISSPRETTFNRTENISLLSTLPADQFLSLFGLKGVGEEFVVPSTGLHYQVLNASEGIVTAKLLVEVGESFRLPGYAWNSTVSSLGEEQATLHHGPGETEIQTEFGNTSISYLQDKIIVTTHPQIGTIVQVQGSPIPGRIVAVNDENITIDFNQELAGKTLIFEIELLEIT